MTAGRGATDGQGGPVSIEVAHSDPNPVSNGPGGIKLKSDSADVTPFEPLDPFTISTITPGKGSGVNGRGLDKAQRLGKEFNPKPEATGGPGEKVIRRQRN